MAKWLWSLSSDHKPSTTDVGWWPYIHLNSQHLELRYFRGPFIHLKSQRFELRYFRGTLWQVVKVVITVMGSFNANFNFLSNVFRCYCWWFPHCTHISTSQKKNCPSNMALNVNLYLPNCSLIFLNQKFIVNSRIFFFKPFKMN